MTISTKKLDAFNQKKKEVEKKIKNKGSTAGRKENDGYPR
jgi:hypothetical protein